MNRHWIVTCRTAMNHNESPTLFFFFWSTSQLCVLLNARLTSLRVPPSRLTPLDSVSCGRTCRPRASERKKERMEGEGGGGGLRRRCTCQRRKKKHFFSPLPFTSASAQWGVLTTRPAVLLWEPSGCNLEDFMWFGLIINLFRLNLFPSDACSRCCFLFFFSPPSSVFAKSRWRQHVFKEQSSTRPASFIHLINNKSESGFFAFFKKADWVFWVLFLYFATLEANVPTSSFELKNKSVSHTGHNPWSNWNAD